MRLLPLSFRRPRPLRLVLVVPSALLLCVAPTAGAAEAPGRQCHLLHKQDCRHGDFKMGPAKTPEDCCNWCANTPGCRAFTHAVGADQYQGAMCYLKSNCTSILPSTSCTSGLLGRLVEELVPSSAPAPAPPPPPHHRATPAHPAQAAAPAPLPAPVMNFVVETAEMLPSVDCNGADLSGGGNSPAQTPTECAEKCEATPGCLAFTHKIGGDQYKGAMCYLKTDCVTVTTDTRCTSGIMIGKQAGVPQFSLSMPAQGTATLVQTARDTGDRMASEEPVEFHADFSTTGPVVDVSSTALDQEIVGFGGAFTEASALVFASMDVEMQQDFLQKYFDTETGIGYSLGRVHINSCDFSPEPGSWSEDDVEEDFALLYFDFAVSHDAEAMIPLIKAATDKIRASGRELKLFASPWSPPAWMKTNHEMVNGGKLRPECAASWAQYFVKWIAAYKAQGIPIWAVTPQNEPMNPAGWEACVYTPDEEAEWLGSHLGPALQISHPEVLILPYDHNKDAVYTWARTMYSHPTAASYTSGIAFHWYSGDSFENVAQIHKDFPQALLLPTEATWEKHRWSAGTTPESGDWAFGEGYAHDILGDLNAGAAGWTDWNLLLDEQGGPNHLGNYCDAPMMANVATGKLYLHPQYYYVGHFSKFIFPGSRRIMSTVTGTPRYQGPVRSYGTCNGQDGLEATAFVRPDNRVVTVVLNCGDDPVDFKLKDGARAIRASIPAHGIQTYIFERTQGLYV